MDSRAFFDLHAPRWDSYQTDATYAAIGRILDAASIGPGQTVLDVGAGTGILYPYFRAAGVRAYTAVEISAEMARIFRAKHPDAEVIEADYEASIAFRRRFDMIMIFNAFPHFRDQAAVFERSRSYLEPGGRLLICHSLSREALAEHHRLAGGAVAGDVLVSDRRFRDLYRGAGFRLVRIENTDIFYSEGTA
jgi:cyclopropane fatty-acyl-phospholipid synthase-like methyltransferase